MLTPQERDLQQRVNMLDGRVQRLERELRGSVGPVPMAPQNEQIESLRRAVEQLRADVTRLEQVVARRRV